MTAIRGLLLLAVTILAARAAAEEPPPPPVATPLATPSSADISRHILELESDSFHKREAASRALLALGPDSIDPLRQALPELDREAADRAAEILAQLSRSRDQNVHQAAKSVLKALGESDDAEVNAIARNLDARGAGLPRTREPGGVRRIGGLNFRIAGNAGGLQIQGLNLQANKNDQITIQINNNERAITLNEDGKVSKLEDRSGKDIRIEVTETVNGQPVVKKYAAADLEELKQKHPDAVAIYERLNGVVGNGALNLQPGDPALTKARQEAQKRIDELNDQIRDAIQNGDLDAMRELQKEQAEARREVIEAYRKALGR